MGFFSSLIKAAVKTVTLPLDVVSDTARAVTGREVNQTVEKADSIADDLEDALDSLLDD